MHRFVSLKLNTYTIKFNPIPQQYHIYVNIDISGDNTSPDSTNILNQTDKYINLKKTLVNKNILIIIIGRMNDNFGNLDFGDCVRWDRGTRGTDIIFLQTTLFTCWEAQGFCGWGGRDSTVGLHL